MSTPPQCRTIHSLGTPRSLQRAVFGAASNSLVSLESLPLTEGGFRPRPSYGSIFSYYHMLRRGSVLSNSKVCTNQCHTSRDNIRGGRNDYSKITTRIEVPVKNGKWCTKFNFCAFFLLFTFISKQCHFHQSDNSVYSIITNGFYKGNKTNRKLKCSCQQYKFKKSFLKYKSSDWKSFLRLKFYSCHYKKGDMGVL